MVVDEGGQQKLDHIVSEFLAYKVIEGKEQKASTKLIRKEEKFRRCMKNLLCCHSKSRTNFLGSISKTE
jgi:hypothetical protein